MAQDEKNDIWWSSLSEEEQLEVLLLVGLTPEELNDERT
jgi:hypothetical protein